MGWAMRVAITEHISVLIDPQDAHVLLGRRWSTFRGKNGRCYVNTHISGRTVYLHRLIMNAPEGMEVDHISRDTLDNRRCNLRVVTHHQNLQNADWPRGKTGFRGVSLLKDGKGHRTKRYVAQIGYLGKHVTGGVYATVEEAAEAARLLREHACWLAARGVRSWEPVS